MEESTPPCGMPSVNLLPALVSLVLRSSLSVSEALTDPGVHVSLDSTLVHLQFQSVLPDLVKSFLLVNSYFKGICVVLSGIFNLLE